MTMNYPNSEQSKAIPFFARFLSADQDEAPTPDSPPILNPLPFGLGNGLLTGKIVN
ncbi:microviridin/marinostatin family tricyclic proteinase inhibitor [Microcystis panniformis]|uniref:microviridin/marinostatin family tricyclic proteinase inhibitor n=1 Tax=Microcystis panniformis TaxID=513223 RepID=UPI00350F40A9